MSLINEIRSWIGVIVILLVDFIMGFVLGGITIYLLK